MAGLFEPGPAGFRRQVRAVRVTAGVMLLAGAGLAAYATFSAGRGLFSLVSGQPSRSGSSSGSSGGSSSGSGGGGSSGSGSSGA
ncbi:hypothetical protein CHLRE_15g636840v5 [Chlamydomonas reinhardtii]|uniref:Uncharacterized protein n=1 Tax=Chlamydomonas reinhardtii TaxID=3055 RepID=A0A2K3CWJ1_CHLRE|nr:uncharacterized protein CHLRE_15g636840v5 [Chlamydomonas reinhardtii]PNW72645.1 hypothetical protein CHLRE_15g636840v5 [Chlamydomonas reinhardtii]